MSNMREFKINETRWNEVLFKKFEDEKIEFMVGTCFSDKTCVRVMVEHQDVSKALDILRSNGE